MKIGRYSRHWAAFGDKVSIMVIFTVPSICDFGELCQYIKCTSLYLSTRQVFTAQNPLIKRKDLAAGTVLWCVIFRGTFRGEGLFHARSRTSVAESQRDLSLYRGLYNVGTVHKVPGDYSRGEI